MPIYRTTAGHILVEVGLGDVLVRANRDGQVDFARDGDAPVSLQFRTREALDALVDTLVSIRENLPQTRLAPWNDQKEMVVTFADHLRSLLQRAAEHRVELRIVDDFNWEKIATNRLGFIADSGICGRPYVGKVEE